MNNIIYYLLVAVASLISITLHECAHGYTAYKLGDSTAKERGRLTLNPLKHIDPIGLIMLIVLKIGFAKPIPVNPYYFEDRKKGMLSVSLAGPVTNLIVAVITGRLMVFVAKYAMYSVFSYILFLFLMIMTQLNIGYAVFNLLPFPPLDGSKIFASLIPQKWEVLFYRYQKYFYAFVFILYFVGALDYIINPVINFIYDIIIS